MSNLLTGQYYQLNASLFHRFGYHAVVGVKKEIGPRDAYPKNLLEKMGDAGLWVVEELPRKVWKGIKDPRLVTIVLTVFALLATSLVFYPFESVNVIKIAILFMPLPPLWALRFTAYIFTLGLIISSACRAEGRFINKELMDRFYHPTQNISGATST